MSQNQLKEINGDANSNSQNNNKNRNGSISVENGNDINARKAALTPLEFRVTQQHETERPFSNKYNKFWEAGTYHCVVCDAELFQSETKFESKSGWPAFYNVVDPKRVKLTADLSHIGANLLLLVAKPDLARTEVSCANCNAHLGHLFKDGPKPTGLRYCINSSSLNFKSASGDSTDNNVLICPITTNGNGTVDLPIREYVCKPENTCNRPSTTANTPVTPTSGKDFPGSRSAREQFFSSLESNGESLPPMGALCLNNQSCQRVAPRKPPPPAPLEKLEKPRPPIISNGAENNVNSSKLFSNNANNTGVAPNSASKIVTTPVSSKSSSSSRFPKGASLTAARINFFQKISAKQDQPSPSRWAATFNSKFVSSPNKSSSPLSSNNTLENEHSSSSVSVSNHSVISSNSSGRFPNSCSSGSLSTVLYQPKPGESSVQPRRSASGFFANSSYCNFPSPVSTQQISTAPKTVALRETTL